MDIGGSEALRLLNEANLEPVGVLTEASNLTVLVDLLAAGQQAIYKPTRGERPLADFPAGTLAAREVGAYLISEAAGWALVPPTVLRDGPLGTGSVQWWVKQSGQRQAAPSQGLVQVFGTDELPDQGWLPIISGRDEVGRTVVVAHADDPGLRAMSLMDVVLNNADRKAAHLTIGTDGRLWAFDHGLCLHTEDKLRTVLWGWAGQPLSDDERDRLLRLEQALDGELEAALTELLSAAEVAALRLRIASVGQDGVFPVPSDLRYPLPWPLW